MLNFKVSDGSFAFEYRPALHHPIFRVLFGFVVILSCFYVFMSARHYYLYGGFVPLEWHVFPILSIVLFNIKHSMVFSGTSIMMVKRWVLFSKVFTVNSLNRFSHGRYVELVVNGAPTNIFLLKKDLISYANLAFSFKKART